MRASWPGRVVGTLLLVVTIGLASCQALFLGPPEAGRQLSGPSADGRTD
ncbi:MAG: hypothetical protein ACFCVH_17855 [Alphaproteobacteria bacterium]